VQVRCIAQGLGNKAILPSAGHGVRADGLGFDGFETTAATPLPNQVFDVLLPLLGESELKVSLSHKPPFRVGS